jgi:hypothetical protein
MSEPRAYYMSYVEAGKRAGQVKRVHVLREDGKWAGRWAHCGQSSGAVTKSSPVWLQPIPFVLPDGLTWCSKCVASLARKAMPTAVSEATS